MDAKKFQELSERIRQILEEAGIEVEKISLSATVNYSFYDSIKGNFPDCPHSDRSIYAGQKAVWHVAFNRNPLVK